MPHRFQGSKEGEDFSGQELLIRIDERTKNMQADIVLIKDDFVKKEEFKPIQKLVYGLVALILTAVVGGILALVLK